jgi:phosphatidate cytidylyltransferase
MLRWRLLSAAILIFLATGSAWLDVHGTLGAPPGLWMIPLFVVAIVLGTREMLDLFAAGGYHLVRWTVYCGTLLVALGGCGPLGQSLVLQMAQALWGDNFFNVNIEWLSLVMVQLEGPNPIILFLALTLVILLALELRRYGAAATPHVVQLALAAYVVLHVGLLGGFLALLRFPGFSATGLLPFVPLLSVLVVVKSSDAGAYFCGRLFGRTKFAPTLSPGKTWEGTLGGVVTAGVVSYLFFTQFVPAYASQWRPNLQPGFYVAYGFLLGIVGIVGDLSISLIKREMHQKDSGDLLPGMGGMLDVLDSLLPAAPVAYFLWNFGFFLHRDF